MSKKPPRRTTVRDAMNVFEGIAPCRFAQDWDNVGLLAGHPDAPCRRILCCIDMTEAVLDEAIADRADLILAYHPPLFRPVKSLHGGGTGTEAAVWRAVAHNIAVYSMHTALDAAPDGTNDVLAELAGLTDLRPFEFVADPADELKLVTFVPPEHADRLAAAMADAGAGRIGHYSHCSFRIPGQGTFFGDNSTAPAVGRKGRLERVDELRIEMVVPNRCLPDVLSALLAAHPYQEPAYDLYPLTDKPTHPGIGRTGRPARKTTLGQLARKLKKAISGTGVQVVGDPEATVGRVAVCVGAAGTLPLDMPRSTHCDCIITGEIRHHHALTILRHRKTAIAVGHWASERPVLKPLADRIQAQIPRLVVAVSRRDADPLPFV